jgi:L-aspartate oxidase
MLQEFDVLIVGSGLAGLTLALQVADHKKVCLVSKREISDSASSWAQGGIAAVLNSEDSVEAHIQDTLISGAGLCDAAITRMVAENGREAVEWLIEQGVGFTREHDNTALHLTREGGHSHRRVVHVADATGRAVQKTLAQKVREHANITLLENHIAVDLITSKKIKKSNENNC